MNIFYLNRFYIFIFFVTSFASAVDQTHADILNAPELIDIRLTLTALKDIQHELEDDPSELESDVIIEIILVCVEMYEKIVEVTVTHSLMVNVAGQQNLHDAIVRIIVLHVIKIINILYHEFLQFVFNHKITWKEKIAHSLWIFGVILIIKTGIEKLPKSINPAIILTDVFNNNGEKAFWPTAKKTLLGDSLTKKL